MGFAIAIAGLLGLARLAHAEESTGDAKYAALLTDLKSGDTDIDYTAFREAYAESSHYDPYGEPPERGAMLDAAKAENCTKVLDAANKVLDGNFTDIQAHILAANCAKKQSDASTAKFHHDVALGLIRSIAHSGDGGSADSPFVVTAVREEYAFLFSQGYRVTMQALVQCGKSECDAMTVQDQGGATKTFYFDVSRSMLWLTKQLGSGKPSAR
ncbi:MAG TPA: DUF4919 domain-containing protein [Rhizomicrobium sp.]|nr:DUF4919 domain-containing protein [Rhizomicrobium sp.]